MALQWQIWSTFITVLWCSKTKIIDETGILVLVRVLWDVISKLYWQFWQSFFQNALESSYTFNPFEIMWRKIVRSVCLKPVSVANMTFATLWSFTVPAYGCGIISSLHTCTGTISGREWVQIFKVNMSCVCVWHESGSMLISKYFNKLSSTITCLEFLVCSTQFECSEHKNVKYMLPACDKRA